MSGGSSGGGVSYARPTGFYSNYKPSSGGGATMAELKVGIEKDRQARAATEGGRGAGDPNVSGPVTSMDDMEAYGKAFGYGSLSALMGGPISGAVSAVNAYGRARTGQEKREAKSLGISHKDYELAQKHGILDAFAASQKNDEGDALGDTGGPTAGGSAADDDNGAGWGF